MSVPFQGFGSKESEIPLELSLGKVNFVCKVEITPGTSCCMLKLQIIVESAVNCACIGFSLPVY